MTSGNSAQGSSALEMRFLWEGQWGAWLRQWVEEDIQKARFSRQFRLFYQLRPLLPIPVRQLLQRHRNRGLTVPDDWYLPRNLLSHLESSAPEPVIWPEQADYAFVVTHDVETAEGVKKIDRLAQLEEGLGFRSCWNIVPYKYSTDPGLIRDLVQRGHEIGVHGFNHDGKLFLNKRTFDARRASIQRAAEQLNAVGFRAPMVHRNLRWQQAMDFQYDSSCFDVDPFQAMPGGVQSWWPFQVGRMIELPYTLPQDHTLLVTLGETTDRIWRDKLDWIRRFHGMALLLTHPDYLDTDARMDLYRGFLEHVRAEGRYWHTLPREIAAWAKIRLDPAPSVQL